MPRDRRVRYEAKEADAARRRAMQRSPGEPADAAPADHLAGPNAGDERVRDYARRFKPPNPRRYARGFRAA